MDVHTHGQPEGWLASYQGELAGAAWSPRARHLLEEIHALSIGWLESAIRRVLQGVDQTWFEQAARSRDPRQQQVLFESRHLLQRGGVRLERDFLDHISAGFARIGSRSKAEPAPAPSSEPWRLLETGEQAWLGALEQQVNQVSWQCAPLLYELSFRLAALVGSSPLEGAELPLSPRALADALRQASAPLALPANAQLSLVKVFEQAVLATLEPLYATINEHLQADGILPHLRPYGPIRAAAEPAPRASPRIASVPATATPGPPMLQLLRDGLRRQRVARDIWPAPPRRRATPGELDLALASLQRPARQLGSGWRDPERLQHSLLDQLNQGAAGAETGLDEHARDILQLLSLLFDALGEQLPSQPQAQSVLDRLQLPLLRLALREPSFFESAQHPARRLLETMAQTAHDWLEGAEEGADHELSDKLDQLLQRVEAEPPSAPLYAELQSELDGHIAQLERKARISERRQIEAMQGRERLELARQQATAVLALRVERAAPEGLLRVLLERAWCDVLALTLLRHGEHSEEFIVQLRITDQLLGKLPTADRLQLRRQVETGLRQIGMQEREAEEVALRLLEQPDVAAVGRLGPANDLSFQLERRQRLGASQDQAQPSPLAPLLLDPGALQVLDRLQRLPFGSWFEFQTAANDAPKRRKLAWFSPRSGRSLLLNQRGQRGEELSLAQLANALSQGHARELPARQRVFEQAWSRMTGQLEIAKGRQA